MKILIADDETPAREELQFMLEELLPQADFQQWRLHASTHI